MKLGIGLVAALMAGCQSRQPAIYVDLNAVDSSRMSPTMAVPHAATKGLPAQVSVLAGLGPAQLDLRDTRARLDEARALLRTNRAEALRTLAQALYRAYASEAETDRASKSRELELETQTIRQQADDRISAQLKSHAQRRWPLADRLAFLIGFPFTPPERMPAPENPQDARRHAQAAEIWRQLLAQDVQFGAEVSKILEEAESDLASKRTQLLIDFTQKLNAAADRAQQEAQAAIAANSGDAMGRFADNESVSVPSSPSRSILFADLPRLNWPPLSPIDGQGAPMRADIEHELAIWLAQNGYRRVTGSDSGPDKTKEFKAWLDARNIGR